MCFIRFVVSANWPGTHPTAGSFVKSTKKPDSVRSFEDAVREKYLKETDDTALFIRVSSSKVMETYGADKIRVRQAQLDKLETAFLLKMSIADLPVNTLNLVALRHLNLGYNLFRSIKTVVQICATLPVVETLILNGNRFSDYKLDEVSPVPSVKELSLSHTLIDHSALKQWAIAFPKIEILTLAHNCFVDGDGFDLMQFTHLRALDLSYNALTSIPCVLPASVTHLTLSHNQLERLSTTALFSVKTVDLSYNYIASWDVIDDLHLAFPNLTELRVNCNKLPVNNFKSLEELQQLQFIYTLARWSGKTCLAKLDGMAVSRQEQTDADLYFISKVVADEITYNRTSTRWTALTDTYGIALTSSTKSKSTSITSKVVELQVQYDGEMKSLKALKTATVQKLKAMISRAFKINGVLPQSLQLQYTQPDTGQSYALDDDFMAVSYYNLDSGSIIHVTK